MQHSEIGEYWNHIRAEVPESYLDFRPGSGNSMEIYDIVVASPYRRQGYGRKLVDALIKKCEVLGINRIYAITRAENRIAQEFYEELNFRPSPLYNFYGVRTESGDRTIDAVMYIRDLEMNP